MRSRSRLSSGCILLLAAILLGVILIVTLYYNVPTRLVSLELWQSPSQGIESAMEGKLCHVDQDDGRLVDYVVQSGLILPPPSAGAKYNLARPKILDPSMGQSKVVQRVLKNMTSGFFIECGALDGETRSNTLYLEKKLGWKGLLIEADPDNFRRLKLKRRKAYSVNVCLATKRYPHVVMFQQQFNTGKIFNETAARHRHFPGTLVRVQCVPIYTLLLALNVTTVDYFSLDVEGAEFAVLRTIPFDKVLIRVLSVEYIHNPVSKEEIVAYMAGFGYKVEARVSRKSNLANDYIFVHKSV